MNVSASCSKVWLEREITLRTVIRGTATGGGWESRGTAERRPRAAVSFPIANGSRAESSIAELRLPRAETSTRRPISLPLAEPKTLAAASAATVLVAASSAIGRARRKAALTSR